MTNKREDHGFDENDRSSHRLILLSNVSFYNNGSTLLTRFLAKFGFQQTNMNDINTQGYIYGNISTKDNNVTNSMTLVVTDSEYFLEFYGNRSVMPRTKACDLMFTKLDRIAWDQTCNDHGTEDFLRRIPCPQNEYCVDEDSPETVIPGGNQFTFQIRDTSQPR